MVSCEDGFIIDSLLEVMAFKLVQFRFSLEASDVQFKFRGLICSIYLLPIRLVDFFHSLSYFFPGSLFIVELALTVLKNKSGSDAATITNNKIRFSEVCLSSPIRLTVKLFFCCSVLP